MQYHLKNIDEDFANIKLKLTHFSINNIKWACLFSGMGIIHPVNEKEIKHISKHNENVNNAKELLNNYVPLKCLYKKGKAVFNVPNSEMDSTGKYIWDYNSFDKTIPISAQIFSITSLCHAAELIYEADSCEGKLMLKSAQLHYDFISTYLRNDDGLFISGEDKTKYFNDELRIKTDPKNYKLFEQLLVMESMLYLHRLTSNSAYEEYFLENSQKYLDDATSIFEYLFDNYNLLLELSTKEIALSISSLTRCCSITKNLNLVASFRYLIALLCAELESRLKITGEVQRSYSDYNSASLITHFRVVSALLEGYMETHIDKFSDLAAQIFYSLNDFYDPSIGLFIQGDYKQVSYSIRDISEIIKCLIMHYIVFDDENTLKLIKEFYMASIETTGIVQSVPQGIIEKPDLSLIVSNNISLMDDIQKAPVFLKSFRINFNKKNTVYTTSKFFNSIYGIYSSYILLFYLNIPMEINN